MRSSSSLPKGARWYVSAIVLSGGLAVGHSLYALWNSVDPRWLLLAALTLLSGAITVRIPLVTAKLSVSEAFVFTSVLLFGVPAGTVTAALDGLIGSLWLRPKRDPFYRTFFNCTAPALSLWLSAHSFFRLTQSGPLLNDQTPLPSLLVPLAIFTALYFFLNSSLIALAIGLEQRVSAAEVWKKNFLWLSLNFFSGASIATLLVAYTREAELVSALWIIVPILVVSYLTYRTAMGRVEDANLHLTQLNSLYLSTIETLAMAIDAKDQITHGHIRRVQRFAVGLAKTLGVTEEKQTRAIEAAALLHDMGKLAVPDYILNKPGPLTPAEYEKVKLHASVGADILSAIEFPYPVVPIVRHHHESWDGTGYPDGLKGVDIPIGARILSVVDCFDALTSDRPYRPRLGDSAALEILQRRRGTMYDPVVVDSFTRVYAQLAGGSDATLEESQPALSAIAQAALPLATPSDASSARLGEITASTEEMLTLYELSRGLVGPLTIDDAATIISKHLRRLVPAAFCVFYVYEAEGDELVVAHAAGDTGGMFTGLRIPLGQRLTGWVGANRQTIVNSDPLLDLGEAARGLQPPLKSSISIPLVSGDSLVGVLTLYSTTRNAFSEDHRRVLEAIARQVSQTLRGAKALERDRASALRDSLTGLPNVERLRQFASSISKSDGTVADQCSVLFLDVDGLSHFNKVFGRGVGDLILGKIVDAARQSLRAADLLFRYGSDEFVVFLDHTDAATAAQVAGRLDSTIRHSDLGLPDLGAKVAATIGTASAPEDGTSFDELLSLARRRATKTSKAAGAEKRSDSVH